MPLTQQKHYTIGYHDQDQHKYEICEYAIDAYDAMQQAKKDVPSLREHPSFIAYCVTEEVKKISDIMASGIPMGH